MKLGLAVLAIIVSVTIGIWFRFWKIAGNWKGKKEHDENSYS